MFGICSIKMIKKKQFYCLIFCFFFFLAPFEGVCGLLGSDIEAEMNKIKAHNKLQEKNKKFIKDHTLKTPESALVQEDGYWDMAFHAKFADYGDKDSQFIIAKAYEEGTYTGVNLKKALAFYKKASEQGHIEASMKLGQVYLEEKWVQKDEEKALYYYLKAAKEDYTPALLKVSQLYESKKEYKKAYHYMEKAMKQIFPKENDLEKRSPDLARLFKKIEDSHIIETEASFDFKNEDKAG